MVVPSSTQSLAEPFDNKPLIHVHRLSQHHVDLPTPLSRQGVERKNPLFFALGRNLGSL